MTTYATTEITSAEIPSDNPVHQRLYFPYEEAAKIISGKVLELGCGWGRGVEKLVNVPYLDEFADNTFDFVVTFQVIEHIRDDHTFLQEAHRVLKPGGKILLTTVNKDFSLSRNPWHVREYRTEELRDLMKKYFRELDAKGVGGNEKVWAYYAQNKASVQKIMRWDVLDLQHKLPAWMLRIPYEILNRFNRNQLLAEPGSLAAEINWNDHYLSNEPENCIDYYFVGTK